MKIIKLSLFLCFLLCACNNKALTPYDAAQQACECMRLSKDSSEEGVEKIVQRFYAAAYDDLNAPKVLALAGEVVRKSGLSGSAKRYLVELIDSWLGLDLLSPLSQEVGKESDPRIDDLVQKREAARQKKNFSEADRIRDLLMDEGVTIEDTPDGSTWHRFK